MGQGQDVVFTGGIGDPEGHLVMVEFSEIWIQFHIFQKVMHPSHIPLEGKAQAALLRCLCDAGPCGGFLGDHDGSDHKDAVQMAEEFDGLQIFIFSVLVGDPVSVAAPVVQIQHGGHGVHPEPVHMEVLHPVKGVGDQEVFHFVFPVIKDLCSPVGMLAFSGIRVLIKRFPVKIRQAMGVFWKMGRDPV